MNNKKVVDPKFAKGQEYSKVIKEIEKKGKCPFCPENLKYHKNKIEKRERNWFITKISWPYENSELHFIIIGNEHKENIIELTTHDMEDILLLIRWVNDKYDIPGGAFVMRFGETLYTGATVCHLHAHIVVPKKGKTVNFPIG